MMLVDQHARDQALNPGLSFIVQAPAGSGKTGLLVRRILRLLCVVEKPEEILAITFTRKATAEMRKRVIDALLKAHAGTAFETHEQDMLPHALAVLARDDEKQWQLLQQPQRLKIQTIDSLCAELVRKMPWSTRFGGIPQIETDLEALYTRAAQNLIEKIDHGTLQAAIATLLVFCNGDLKTLKSRLAGMLYQREAFLQLIFAYQALDSRETIEQQWLAVCTQSVDALDHAFGPGLFDELIDLARYAQQHRSEKTIPPTDEQLEALHQTARLPGLRIRNARWRLIESMLCTGKGDFRKQVNKNNGFPKKGGAKDRIQKILSDLQDDSETQALFHQFRLIPDPHISDTEWDYLCAIKTVLPALAQELYVTMSEQNCADYEELAQRAINALGDPEKPSDLALIQDYRIKHILMDEFQDTSPAQMRLLERLTAGWESDDNGRSLFLVGDPMQSIYGFRGADVRVFLRVRDQGINNIRPKSLDLKINFRSSPDIINWVNKTMAPVFPAVDEPALARVKYSPSEAQKTIDGAIHTHLCVADSSHNAADYRYAEALQIQLRIQDIRQQYPDDSIAVLARKRSPLSALAECLRVSHTDFEAVDLETLDEQSIVQDLINLCCIFVQPMDTLAWLAVLRAPWCGLSLKDLTQIRNQNKSVLEVLRQDVLPPELSQSGAAALRRVASTLLPLVAIGQRLEIKQRVRRAWLALRGPACFEVHELGHVEAFFEMLNELDSETYSLNRERLQQACKQHKSSAPANSLKLMTFHKAKGLEFDHVILTGMAGKSGGDNRRQPLLHTAHMGKLTLVAAAPRTSASATNKPPPGKAGFIKQYLKGIEDEEAARLLYVAVTRAKKQLFLFGTLKRNADGALSAPQKGSLLHLLWPELHEEFQRPEFQTEVPDKNNAERDTTDAPNSLVLMSLPDTLEPLKLPADIQVSLETELSSREEIDFNWAQEDARIVGLMIHHLLEFTDFQRLLDWREEIDPDMIRSGLIRFGLIEERIVNASRRVVDILQSSANDARAHWIFDPKNREVKTEWALSCELNGEVANFVIDRSFIDKNGVRWIIDFKTSTHEGADLKGFLEEEERRYFRQLKQYAALVQELESEREIRLGLYFPAMAQWRELSIANE